MTRTSFHAVSRVGYRWQSEYYHFLKWCKDGSWERIWQHILNKYAHLNIQLDGTHTPAKLGGQMVGYQGVEEVYNE